MNGKAICAECGKPRERCRPAVQHVNGKIDRVCPQCWRDLEYGGPLRMPGYVPGDLTRPTR